MRKMVWYPVRMGIYEKAMEALRGTIAENHKSAQAFAEQLGINPPTLTRWLSGQRVPSFAALAPILDAMGADLIFRGEGEPSREVCFVSPKRLNVIDAETPIPEDYIAVPLASGEVAAGRGMIAEDQIKSWVLVWKNHDSVRFRTNLMAVEIGKGQSSMVPTLHPQDILLVDRDDFNSRFTPPGNIFLVREPDDSVTVKRVTIKQRNGDMMLTFYSDNAVEHPPMSYSLGEDYQGDVSRAVVGRVVWAWSDMSRK